MLPLAMGAVVEGVSSDFQTPLSGQRSPVFTLVPSSAMVFLLIGMNSGWKGQDQSGLLHFKGTCRTLNSLMEESVSHSPNLRAVCVSAQTALNFWGIMMNIICQFWLKVN